jgi:hypothetical protein
MAIPRKVIEELYEKFERKYPKEVLDKILWQQFEFWIEEMSSGRNNNIRVPFIFKSFIPEYKRKLYGYKPSRPTKSEARAEELLRRNIDKSKSTQKESTKESGEESQEDDGQDIQD